MRLTIFSIFLVIIGNAKVNGQCISTLKNITPQICVGDTYLLDTVVESSSDNGVWTIDSIPSTVGISAVIVSGVTDTIFDVSDLATTYGTYKLMYTVTDGPEMCKDSIYIIVNQLPVLSMYDGEICIGDAAFELNVTSDTTLVNYIWSGFGWTGPVAYVTNAGPYTVHVTDINGCLGEATGRLYVHDLPEVNLLDGNFCLPSCLVA